MKTSELTGAALDWAVAKCEGYKIHSFEGGKVICDQSPGGLFTAAYSTKWAQGGPIIERENISVIKADAEWAAYNPKEVEKMWINHSFGPTVLIAAMRCYVASKLGDEVEIPEELL